MWWLRKMDAYAVPVLIGLTLAFVGQAVASWQATAALRVTVKELCRDIQELQELHPRRSSNPGGRYHKVDDFCTNPDCHPVVPESLEGST
jgi:hypothetical protein